MTRRPRRFRSPHFAVLLAALMMPPAPAAAQRDGMAKSIERDTLAIVTAKGVHRFKVELARTPDQQSRGLMFRRRLAPDAGMLFIYRRPLRVQMWMKNTLIPLDMIFIAADGGIVRIAQRTVPLSLASIGAPQPVTGVLELNGGTAARLGIAVGDRIDHPAFAARKPGEAKEPAQPER